MQILQTLLQAQTNVLHNARLSAAWMACLDDVKNHGVRDAIPDLECIGLLELSNPLRVEVHHCVGVAVCVQ